MTDGQLMEKLRCYPWHVCPDGTTQYVLHPPHESTNGWVELTNGGRVNYGKMDKWMLDELFISIRFCPWCGQKLPTEGDANVSQPL